MPKILIFLIHCFVIFLPVLASNFAPWWLVGMVVLGVVLFVDEALKWSGHSAQFEHAGTQLDFMEPTGSRCARAYSVIFIVFFLRFLFWEAPSLNGAVELGRIIAWSLLAGIVSLIAGHLLIHERRRGDRFLGHMLFCVFGYSFFPVAHIYGHHRFTAQADDPHLARKNESVYAFFLRSAWAEEKLRIFFLRSPHSSRALRRKIWLSGLGSLSIAVSLGLARGPARVAEFALIAVLSRFLVATVNYIQHYGLSRNANQSFNAFHAWDLNFKSTNWIFFGAGLHVDHHTRAQRRLTPIRQAGGPFAMPFNFPLMMGLALAPPLFFATIHPHLERGLKP